MANIKNNATDVDGLAVDAGSKAARTSLWESGGQRLTKINGESVSPAQEAIIIAGVNDKSIRHVRVDRSGNLGLNRTNVLFTEAFEGATFPATRWTTPIATTTVATVNASGLNINSGNILTASTGYFIKTLRSFSKLQKAPLVLRARARLNPASNSVLEIGFGDATTLNGAHTNGCYFQYTSGGLLQAVLTFNGVDITSSPMTISSTNYYTFDILVDDDQVHFLIQDSLTGDIVEERKIPLPSSQSKIWSSLKTFAFTRLYITASAAPTAPTLSLSNLDVNLLDVDMGLSWGDQMVLSGYNSNVNPNNFNQSANYSNNTVPANATLSNTAAGYTTLGGLFSFAAVAGANTDYALFSFTVPSPYIFVCNGIDIETFNTGAAVATTPTVLMWSFLPDALSVSLANANNFGRVTLGVQDFPTGSAIGSKSTKISQSFVTPYTTNPGRLFTIILRMPIGTATGSQVIQGMITCKGYFQ